MSNLADDFLNLYSGLPCGLLNFVCEVSTRQKLSTRKSLCFTPGFAVFASLPLEMLNKDMSTAF